MYKYVVKRILWIIVIMVCVAFVIFTITYLTPGDPAKLLLGDTATPEAITSMQAKLGIDKPYIVQLGDYLYDSFIKFDFGTSWNYQVPVFQELFNRLPRTIGIGLSTMILSTIISIPLGIWAAFHQGKWQDYGMIGLCMILISLPGFWLAYMAIMIFSVKLGWFPSHGIGGIQYYVLPIAIGTMTGIAGLARQARSSVLEIMRADLVTTAKAKGQKNNVIIWKHILPNAMMPIITTLGGALTMIVAGTAITERVFSIPGVGLYLLNGITYRDYPVIRSCTLFLAAFSTVAVLITDLAYAWLDPRIKAQYSGKNMGRRG